MDGQIVRVPIVGSSGYAVERSSSQHGRKQGQPEFHLEGEGKDGEKNNAPRQGAAAMQPEQALDFEVAPPKHGEAGSQVNVVA